MDIYTDYLLSSFGATTATGLASILPEVSHDAITRFLSQETLTSRDLWKVVKPQVRVNSVGLPQILGLPTGAKAQDYSVPEWIWE